MCSAQSCSVRATRSAWRSLPRSSAICSVSVAYKLCPKLPAAYAGEVFGTGILGGLASYPIAAVLMGNTKAALFTFVPSFLVSTAVGAAISVLVLSALKRTHVLGSVEGAER